MGGRNRGRYPIKVVLEKERSKYRYFHKHYGIKGAIVSLVHWCLRYAGYRVLRVFRQHEALDNRLKMIRFVESGQEPDVGYEPLAGASPPARRPALPSS